MSAASAAAAAVRLQGDLRAILSMPEFTERYAGTVEPAQTLLTALEQAGVADRHVPRGRPIKRVSSEAVTRLRKRTNSMRG